MRTIWKGSLSFGLVNIPVNVSGAVEANQVAFNQIHEPCKSRIRYHKYCPHCDQEVANEEIIKGYQTPGGMITVTDEDLAAVPLPSLKTVELAGFIREKDVDALMYQKPYYLLPNGSDKAYWLLYHALKKSSKVGIARFAVHSREHLALVWPARGILTLCTLYYPEEIREVQGVASEKPDAKQMELATQLIEQQTIDFRPEEFTDRYREALEKMLEKKKPEPMPAAEKAAGIVDLMDVLRASVKKAKKAKKKKQRSANEKLSPRKRYNGKEDENVWQRHQSR